MFYYYLLTVGSIEWRMKEVLDERRDYKVSSRSASVTIKVK